MFDVDGLIKGITSTINSITGFADEISTTDEERMKLKRKLREVKLKMETLATEIKKAQIEAKQQIISSAKGQPFWRNWRGLVMLGIFLLAALHSVFPGVAYFSSEALAQILKWGLGGYVGGEVLETGIREREGRKKEEAKAKAERERRIRTEIMPAPDVEAPKSPPQDMQEQGEGKAPVAPPEPL